MSAHRMREVVLTTVMTREARLDREDSSLNVTSDYVVKLTFRMFRKMAMGRTLMLTQ